MANRGFNEMEVTNDGTKRNDKLHGNENEIWYEGGGIWF